MVYSLFSKEINGAHSSAQTSKIGPTKKGKPIFGSIIYNNSILTVESMPYTWVTRVGSGHWVMSWYICPSSNWRLFFFFDMHQLWDPKKIRMTCHLISDNGSR